MHFFDGYYSGKWLMDGPQRLSDTPGPLHVNRACHFHARWMKDYKGGQMSVQSRQASGKLSVAVAGGKSPGKSRACCPGERLHHTDCSQHSTNWPILMSAKCHFIIKASPLRVCDGTHTHCSFFAACRYASSSFGSNDIHKGCGQQATIVYA